MNSLLDIIWKGISPEIQAFFGGLNWTYIIMYIIILYGVTYKREFNWFNKLMVKFNTVDFTSWIAGFLIGLTFCLFKGLESGVKSEYVSTLLRSWFLVVVFSSIFIDGIVKLLKFLGKRIDDTEEKKPE